MMNRNAQAKTELDFGGTFHSKDSLIEYLVGVRNQMAQLRQAEVTRNSNSTHFKTLAEYYDFATYAIGMAHHDLLEYPYVFLKSERPDFIVHSNLGMEHIRITPQDYQAFLTRIEGKRGTQCFDKGGYMGSQQEALCLALLSKGLEKHAGKILEYQRLHPDLIAVDALCKVEMPAPMMPDEFSKALTAQVKADNPFRNMVIITNIALTDSDHDCHDIMMYISEGPACLLATPHYF